MNVDKSNDYQWIDLYKLGFAMLIPLLHIEFGDNNAIYWFKQIVSRLGVPFFFVISGFFLTKSVQYKGKVKALLHYEKRVFIMFAFWMSIYFVPLLYTNIQFRQNTIQLMLFQTPGYLWYLSALLYAAVPFCLIGKKIYKYIAATVLYIIGTLFSASYLGWCIPYYGFVQAYYKLFLTTVNGVFFAFPMLCLGEVLWNIHNHDNGKLELRLRWLVGKLTSKRVMFMICFMYVLEVFIVRTNVSDKADTSMYFSLPVLIAEFILVSFDRCFMLNMDSKYIRTCSGAIYCMQYGVIATSFMILKLLGIRDALYTDYIVYFIVIILPIITVRVLHNSKIFKTLSKFIF